MVKIGRREHSSSAPSLGAEAYSIFYGKSRKHFDLRELASISVSLAAYVLVAHGLGIVNWKLPGILMFLVSFITPTVAYALARILLAKLWRIRSINGKIEIPSLFLVTWYFLRLDTFPGIYKFSLLPLIMLYYLARSIHFAIRFWESRVEPYLVRQRREIAIIVRAIPNIALFIVLLLQIEYVVRPFTSEMIPFFLFGSFFVAIVSVGGGWDELPSRLWSKFFAASLVVNFAFFYLAWAMIFGTISLWYLANLM